MTAPRVFIMGAGRVATALAGAFARAQDPASVTVLGLWGRAPDAAQAAAQAAGVPGFGPDLPGAVQGADIVIVAVRDQAIAEVAGRLVEAGLVGPSQVLLHCSGARSAAEALGPAYVYAGGAGTLHPLRAIAEPRSAMDTLAGTIFGIEGNPTGLAAAQALVAAIGGKPLVLAAAHMTRYHAAAAIASNYAVALIDAAVAVLGRAGIDETAAVAALVPLIQGSLTNVAERGIAGALTGPVRRGDTGTVERHLQALADAPDLDALYRMLGLRTVDIARRAQGASSPEIDAVAALLDHGHPLPTTREHAHVPAVPEESDRLR